MTRGFTDRDVPDQSGRTFIVTGANTGIGFETARVLARQGGRVLLGCRSEERAAGAIAKIHAESPESDLEFLPLDQASVAHRGARIHWDDIDGARFYSRQTRYQQSKLANLMYMVELDRRLKARRPGTIAVACHPGLAQTDIGRDFPLIQMAAPLVRAFFNTQAMGAWPTLLAATGPGVEGGDYYGPSRFGELSGPAVKARSNPASRDPELGRRLWELSVEMTGVDPGI